MFTDCPASAAGHTAKAAGHTAETVGHTARTAGHTARTAGHTARTTGHPAKAAGHTKIYKGQRKSSFSIQFINNIRYFASINQTKKYKSDKDCFGGDGCFDSGGWIKSTAILQRYKYEEQF